jgi:23S rRNA (guanosine2251-2'-O)-methyltransferase
MKWNPSSKPKPKEKTNFKLHPARTPAKVQQAKPEARPQNKAKPKPGQAPQKFVPKPVIDDDRRVYGIHAVAATLEHMPARARKLHYVEKSPRIEPLINKALSAGILVEQSARQIFDVNYGTDIVHQGVMLQTAPYPYVDLDEALNSKPKLVVVLDSIEDPRNLGRAARSAFAMGAELLVIPSDRAASVTASAEKAAVGTLARIPVAQVTNLNQAIQKLKKAGLWVVGAAGEAQNALWSCDFNQATAVVIGSEESGLRKLIRQNCDELVRIPMDAGDISLNAADALTIMLYEAKRQRNAGSPR